MVAFLVASLRRGGSESTMEAALTAHPTDVDVPFQEEESNFGVRAPVRLIERSVPVPEAYRRKVDLHAWVGDQVWTGAAFGVVVSRAGEGAEFEAVKLQLDAGRDGMLRETSGTLVHEEDFSFDGHPGRALTIDGVRPNAYGRVPITIHARCILVGDRVYVVELDETQSSPLPADVRDRYLDSFHLLRPVTATNPRLEPIEWKPTRWADARGTVLAPQTGTFKTNEDVEMLGGELVVWQVRGWNVEKRRGVFSLAWTDLPPKLAHKGRDVLYDSERDRVRDQLAKDGGTYAGDEKATFAGRDGARAVRWTERPYNSSVAGSTAEARLLLVGARLYRAIVILNAPTELGSRETAAFFDAAKLD
jgi:hypothetical protein